jgi:phosphoribosylformylglycinamidine (FGAM) synthase-like enzyme
VYEQYDSIVGSRTAHRPGKADAAVLSLAPDGGSGAIAVSIDGNGRRTACDPYTGAVETVLECARNLACVGAEPLGLTNCLNFGNPEKPHIAWQLTRAVQGLRDACLALDVPVVGGNVSLYNEGPDGPIYPTPIVGMVGRLPDPGRAPGIAFVEEGHAVALVRAFDPSFASLQGSQWEKLHGRLSQELPPVDLSQQARVIATLRSAARRGLLASIHDVSEGGLACALAECCIAGGLGARIEYRRAEAEFASYPSESTWLLYGEAPGGFVVSAAPDALEEVAPMFADHEFVRLGAVGGDVLEMRASASEVTVPLGDARAAYEGAIPGAFA